MVYFAIEIQFIWEDGIFLATTLLWDMNHAGHGIISNKKVLLLENYLTKLGIIPTGKVVLTSGNVEYQFFSIFFFLCNTQILRQKAEGKIQLQLIKSKPCRSVLSSGRWLWYEGTSLSLKQVKSSGNNFEF